MILDPITVDQLPERLPANDPRSPLGFRRPLRPDLQALEDATAAADHDRSFVLGVRFLRPSTPAERMLLEVLGYTDEIEQPPGSGLMTRVEFRGGIRLRSWPDLVPPTDSTTTTTETEALP